MSQYTDFIEKTPLVESVEVTVTTGDPGYPGTALEVWGPDGRELLHVVVDATGKRYVLFLAGNYRLPLGRLEEIIANAKDNVRLVEET